MRILTAICICCSLLVTGGIQGASFQESNLGRPNDTGKQEPKPVRSQFDMKLFHEFVSQDLSRPVSRGSLVPFGFVTRTVHGRVVDHQGNSIKGAKVAVVEAIGYSGQCYDENFDLTDDQGRFLVEGQLNRSRIVVRRDKHRVWTQAVTPGQDSIDFVWPAPAQCTISVDPGLNRSADEIWISSAGYWAGMSTMQISTKLDSSGTAVVKELLPGRYRIAITKDAQQAKESERSRVEVGMFRIDAGQNKTVSCRRDGNRRVSGTVAAPKDTPLILKVIRQKSSYSDSSGTVDLMAVDGDGSFLTDPLPPGRYRLKFLGPQPKQPARGNRFGRFGGGGAAPRFTISKRIEIPDADEPVMVKFSTKETETVADFIERTLDTEGQLKNVTWSYADVQVAQIKRHPDRDAVIQELVRIVGDNHSSQYWDHIVLKCLAGMTDSQQVVDALLANVERNPDSRVNAIWMLVFAEHSIGKFADGIAKYRNSEDTQMRRSVYTSLLNYVQRDNTLSAKIVPWLIEGMSDSNDEIRAMIVPVLGRVKAESALPLLIKARSDENPKTRMHAAFAIWQITGDKEQAIKALTVRLRSKNLEGQQEAVYLLGELGELPEITIKALLAKTGFDEKKDYQNAAVTAKHGIKQAAIRTLLKVAPDALPAELKPISKK